ncbi:MAG: zinc metallopeptidase [Fimbriimonadaceae bacterium]|nr:zinc metallopeptidase [Fimbriimonadaceae bacterium]QYK57200.1 MAG: zinc metallopeptidase [Fimbriimonadaceae bacterium]
MRWQGRRQSSQIEDRREAPSGALVAGGGIGTVILALLVMLLGGDPSAVLGPTPTSDAAPVNSRRIQEEEPLREFVAVTLADTEEVWEKLFAEMGAQYQKPSLILFSGQVQSACGYASAQSGPFYCGQDQNIYIDLSFYQMLRDKFGAPGDFAQAYVIAHEVGHHIQKLLGTLDRVHAMRSKLSERQGNDLSVRLELQADFYAGVWAHHARRMAELDEQDIREAIQAASAIGDDAIQMQAQGYTVPDAFTHGTSEQRVRWFMRGWESGRIQDGDTFRVRQL